MLDPKAQAEQDARNARIAAEVRKHYTEWREHRKKHESRWFVNGAFYRGQQHVEYDNVNAKLVSPVTPTYRIQLDINRIRPKIRARLSKFFKSRARPTVIPASTDYTDILNARASEKNLVYQWDRLHLEERYKDARLWAAIGAKSYWWFYWDPTATARVREANEITQQTEDTVVEAGDVCVELGTPFEVLVQDPAISRIGDQPAIQRIRMMAVEDIRKRYPDLMKLPQEAGSAESDKPSTFTDRLATLKAGNAGTQQIQREAQILMIEEFTAPCAKYPKGRYAVVVGDELARMEEELPYEMYDHKVNPFPVVEFCDQPTPGQFWGTTLIEQMIDLQREYNFLRELISENIRAVARPKVIVYKQHNLADGAWTNAAGEVVELTYVPGLPAPIILQAQNVAADCWNLLALINKEFDDLTQIYPAAEGKVASATSGFQTNLLQEATDSVHAPDVREDELTLQEAAWKIRRLCKLGYDVPRLISILGDNSIPEAMEFDRSQIDEFAEVRIQAGSMLPDLKAARAQTALELYEKGLFGNPQDAMVRRRVLSMLDMNGMEVIREQDRLDIDNAERENRELSEGLPVKPGAVIHDHPVHILQHQAFMKSPAFERLDDLIKQAFYAHLITHYDWVNPALAMSLRLQYSMEQLPIASPPPPPMAPAQPGQPQAVGPQGPPSGPQAPPSPQPAPIPAQ